MAQDFDWGSLASAFIPAAVGLLAGGRNRGLAGAYGAAAGMANYGEESLAVDKLNTDIQFKNRAQAMEQQRIDLEAQQQAAQAERWKQADKASEVAMRLHLSQIAEIDRKTEEARTQRAAFNELIKDQPMDEQIRAKADPDGYLKNRRQLEVEKPKRSSLAIVMKGLKIPDAELLAKGGDIGKLTDLVTDINRARVAPRPGNFDLKVIGDKVLLLNQHTGEVRETGLKGGKDKDDLKAAHEIMQEARQQVEAPFKTGPMGAIDMKSLGNTAEERVAKFQSMINERARNLAKERGLPDLFKPNPEASLLENIQSGAIKSESDAVAYLLSQGVPPDQVKAIATAVIQKVQTIQPAKKK